MKNKLGLLVIIALTAVMLFAACNRKTTREEVADIGNKQNPLYGKTFRSITDIPELQVASYTGFRGIGSADFAIHEFYDINGDLIFLFSIVVERDEAGGTEKILDTLNVGRLSARAGEFSLDGESYDGELIASFINVGSDEIARVWRACRNTGIILPVDDITGISHLPFYSGPHYESADVTQEKSIDQADFSIIGSWSYLSNGFRIVENFNEDGSWSEGISGSNLFSRGSWALDGNAITISSYSLFDDNGDWKVDFDPNDVTLSAFELTVLNKDEIILKSKNGYETTFTRYQWE